MNSPEEEQQGTRQLYDDAADDYEAFAEGILRYEEAARGFLQEQARDGARLLDLGCGPGQLTRHLPLEVEVVGLDLSPKMLALARQGRPSGLYQEHDFHEPLPEALGSFDAVLAVGCLNSCRDLGRTLAHLAQATRPGGRLFLSVDERREGLRLQDQPSFAIAPRQMPGVRLYFWSFEETARAVLAAGLLPLRYHFGPGWLFRSQQIEIRSGLWELERPGALP